MEVEIIDEGIYYKEEETSIFEFYLDAEDPWRAFPVSWDNINNINPDNEHDRQWRVFVYAKRGTANVCFKGCESSTTALDCYDLSNGTQNPNSNPDNNLTGKGDQIYHDATDETFTVSLDDYTNSGLGDDIVTGLNNQEDVIEDHGGKDIVDTRGGDDYFISNSGEDIVRFGQKNKDQNTLRLYPTHDKDHLFGWKDP